MSAADPREPSAEHDAAVLTTARSAARDIRNRARRRSVLPVGLALAAGLAVGLLLPGLPWKSPRTVAPPPPAALFVPASAITRGADVRVRVPVERVPADQWYRYIQELLLAGDLPEAERHLHRFLELHPEYRPPP
jgi:hypothetical protein